jgi:hypothetical protein
MSDRRESWSRRDFVERADPVGDGGARRIAARTLSAEPPPETTGCAWSGRTPYAWLRST